ncbi:2-dehydro-3-deoxygalactonokinase [Vibrio panuliri]|uniref:2-keto-3-deoxy-galactonokinase n=1 Tax=Vibrio panuliri TaxID=1381081 RepID=A0ABX3F6U2_9VIBR|nr:2-dehydro-3-deoxygalactonokinase [Vibrio panuliri]KAB1454918.1 2-dehydro-3-deoxygalactonokinase [Vibrio panuliri]OLQ86028.1 hypothetical protein BIY20_15395 [Vibrio panuliri]
MTINKVDWLVIDWGTTNFRAFALTEDGSLVAKIERNLGLLQVENGQFAATLQMILQQWLNDYKHLPIYMAGMVGSAQGWINVPYVDAPVSLSQLAHGTYHLMLPWGAPAYIVPGVRYQIEPNRYDVMRGEEVQLFGLQTKLSRQEFCAALPGTHSKHATMRNGYLERFQTFMTGELFSVLSKHSILGKALPQQIPSPEAFVKGLEESGGSDFTSTLFSARTHRLFSHVEPVHIYDYLSGLLIGQELKQSHEQHLYLVGGEALCRRYVEACEYLSASSEQIDGDEVFLIGMLEIKKVMNCENNV